MISKKSIDLIDLPLDEKKLLTEFRGCSSEGKRIVIQTASLLAKDEKDKKGRKKLHLPYKIFNKRTTVK